MVGGDHNTVILKLEESIDDHSIVDEVLHLPLKLSSGARFSRLLRFTWVQGDGHICLLLDQTVKLTVENAPEKNKSVDNLLLGPGGGDIIFDNISKPESKGSSSSSSSSLTYSPKPRHDFLIFKGYNVESWLFLLLPLFNYYDILIDQRVKHSSMYLDEEPFNGSSELRRRRVMMSAGLSLRKAC